MFATVLTIAASSISGGIAVVGFQKLYDRRVLYSSIHTELVDNYLNVKNARMELEDNPERSAKDVLPNGGFPTASFDSARDKDPIFYTRICSEVSIQSAYGVIHTLESYQGSNGVNVTFEKGGQQKQESPEERDEMVNGLKNIEESLHDAIEELEEYRTKTILRRIFYYRTWGGSPVHGDFEENNSDVELNDKK